ncbi:Curli production assembly/transport component CsgG [Winogradskyella helgolandensis]|uniref:Curli production assembly/transport component CsgG n=1 Tax=Winogradskyella helgolandensis TaxID=2697010 RepID=UPI001E5B52DA|nr:Curli production assembly/transport component CsgG [Winogradskyella helgolandensis]
MTSRFNSVLLSIIMTAVCFNSVFSQETDDKKDKSITKRFTFFEKRGSHAIDLAAGSAIFDGDYPDAEYELYFRAGYKHHITSHLNLNFTYNKYNLAVKDVFNEGFMSFDLNLEYLISPFRNVSPFIYVGGGYNATNFLETTATKAQGGLGIEFLIADGVGVKLFGEYNYMFTDDHLDGLVLGETDDTLLRAGLGLNIYFGGNKKKEALRKKMKTVINSNLIIPYN